MSFLSGSSLPASSVLVEAYGNMTAILVLLCQLVSWQFRVKIHKVTIGAAAG